MYMSEARELTTDELTAHLPLEWRINWPGSRDAYCGLAFQCVLPALEALAAGNKNPEALLSVTFGPVAQIVMFIDLAWVRECMAPGKERVLAKLKTGKDHTFIKDTIANL